MIRVSPLFVAGEILLGLSLTIICWGFDRNFRQQRSFTATISDRNFRGDLALTAGHSKEAAVDKEHLKSAADKVKGAIKEAVGKAMGDKKLQTEGKMDRAKGEARQALGDAKDAVKHANDE